MLRILEPQFVSNLTDRFRSIEHMFLCRFQCLLLDMFQGGHARLFLQQIAQVVGRKAKFVSAVLHGGQSFRDRFAGMEILIQ